MHSLGGEGDDRRARRVRPPPSLGTADVAEEEGQEKSEEATGHGRRPVKVNVSLASILGHLILASWDVAACAP